MSRTTDGWINGFVGMLIFSGSLPATRLAVLGLDPLFVTGARAAVAGIIAVGLLVVFGGKRPGLGELCSLAVVSLGVVVGFPLLTAYALMQVTSAHSTVFLGLLPMFTAVFGVLRGGAPPQPAFWIFSCLGSAAVVGFALSEGVTVAPHGDLLMLAAVLLAGLGYAEGTKLSGRLGGWRVISWALVLALPVMAAVAIATLPSSFIGASASAWAGLAYVSLFSMLIGFVFWYRGLLLGGIVAVSQLQLLQPFFALGWAALLLGEVVSPLMLAATIAVVFCVAGAKRFSAAAVTSSVSRQIALARSTPSRKGAR